MFFQMSWQSCCFYLLLICTQVMPLACLCRNAIASFHMRISGRPCVLTWIFFQTQCFIILYKLYWLDCICVCRLPMVNDISTCRINAVLCLQNLVLSTYSDVRSQLTQFTSQLLIHSFSYFRHIVLVL